MRVLFVIALTTLVSLVSEGQPLEEENSREPTRSPGGEPASQLDEPPMLRDDATSSNVDQAEQEADLCSRCYFKVKTAHDLLGAYESLLKKQKRLIKNKKAAADAAAAAAAAATSRSPKNPRSAPTTSTSTTAAPKLNSTGWRMRSLEPGEIVVHRLRVARSPGSAAANSKLAGRKDLELEKLKREQQEKKAAVCSALQEARDCLDPIGRQCLGDLNYHTNELFVDQSYEQYRCPFLNSGMKPLFIKPSFVRTFEEEGQRPYARPDSSDASVRSRLDKILPKGGPFGGQPRHYTKLAPRPLGVVLTPTSKSNGAVPAAPRSAQRPADTPLGWTRVLGCALAISLLLMLVWQVSKATQAEH